MTSLVVKCLFLPSNYMSECWLSVCMTRNVSCEMAHTPLKFKKKQTCNLLVQISGCHKLTNIHPRNQPKTPKGGCNESKVAQQAKMGEILHCIRRNRNQTTEPLEEER